MEGVCALAAVVLPACSASAVNPRAFVTQTLSGVADILRTVFDALKYVPFPD